MNLLLVLNFSHDFQSFTKLYHKMERIFLKQIRIQYCNQLILVKFYEEIKIICKYESLLFVMTFKFS